MKHIIILAGLCIVSASVFADPAKGGVSQGKGSPENSVDQETAASARAGNMSASDHSATPKTHGAKAKAHALKAKAKPPVPEKTVTKP